MHNDAFLLTCTWPLLWLSRGHLAEFIPHHVLPQTISPLPPPYMSHFRSYHGGEGFKSV